MPRQFDGKFDAVRTVLFGLHILRVLFGGQNLFEQAAQLDFTPGAARLHIRQNLFQIAHARSQRLHFAQSLVHLFETFTDQFERFAQPFLQRALKFFVHCFAHLFQLCSIVRLDLRELRFDHRAQLTQFLLVAFDQLGQLTGKRLQLTTLCLADLAETVDRRIPHTFEHRAQLFPQCPRLGGGFLALARNFILYGTLCSFVSLF